MERFVVAYVSHSGNTARDEGDQGLAQAEPGHVNITSDHSTYEEARTKAEAEASEDADTQLVLEVKAVVPAVALTRKTVEL